MLVVRGSSFLLQFCKKNTFTFFFEGRGYLSHYLLFFLKSFYYFCIREIVITGKALVILSFSRPV